MTSGMSRASANIPPSDTNAITLIGPTSPLYGGEAGEADRCFFQLISTPCRAAPPGGVAILSAPPLMAIALTGTQRRCGHHHRTEPADDLPRSDGRAHRAHHAPRRQRRNSQRRRPAASDRRSTLLPPRQDQGPCYTKKREDACSRPLCGRL